MQIKILTLSTKSGRPSIFLPFVSFSSRFSFSFSFSGTCRDFPYPAKMQNQETWINFGRFYTFSCYKRRYLMTRIQFHSITMSKFYGVENQTTIRPSMEKKSKSMGERGEEIRHLHCFLNKHVGAENH